MKIAVVGDACIDKYIYGSCDRLCPEGPVAVMNQRYETTADGMSANVYNNLKNLCDYEVHHYSNDRYRMEKIRFVDEKSNQLLLRLDTNDSCDRISVEQIQEIKSKNYDAIVIADYCKGYLTDVDLVELGVSSPISFLDSKRKLSREVIGSFNLIKLNEYEYNLNKEFVDKSPRRFVITLGSKGVMYKNDLSSPPKTLQTYDVSGAGDTFLAAVASQVMARHDIYTAIDFAQHCCNKVIQKRGTCVYEKDMD